MLSKITAQFFLLSILCVTALAQSDWPNVGNDKGAMRYSPLKQINRDNVKNLKVAWTYHTGDAVAGDTTTIECTPIVVSGVMYLTTVKTKAVALDAATGRELWRFDPFASPHATKYPIVASGVNRGMAYWADKSGKQTRILFGTADGRLISLDARTGKLDPAFGENGRVSLTTAIEGAQAPRNYTVTSPPTVCRDVVAVGSGADGRGATTVDSLEEPMTITRAITSPTTSSTAIAAAIHSQRGDLGGCGGGCGSVGG